MTSAQANRYLALLDVPDGPPSVNAITDLVGAHLARVPFENVSKLIRRAGGAPPTLDLVDEYLERIAQWKLGGTCYACACHFNALLCRLGYDVCLCGAAMSDPDVHAVNVVVLAGRHYLVDVGYAAPFFEPLRLDGEKTVTVDHGPDSYVLHPRDQRGHSRLDHRRDGEVIHGYTVDPTARDPEHFAPVIADSYRPDSTFLNQLRIVRHTPRRSVSLRNFDITVVEGDAVRRRTLRGPEELCGVVEALFQIPGAVTAEALAALGNRI